MKTRLAIPFAVAVLGGVIGVDKIEKRGDPSAILAQVERDLPAAFKPRTFFVAEPVGGRSWKPKVYRQSSTGRTLEIVMDHKPTGKELDAIFDRVDASGRTTDFRLPHTLAGRVGSVIQIAPPWEEVRGLWWGLTRDNRETAEAKAMLLCNSNPTIYTHTWQHRGERAARPWDVEEAAHLLRRRLQFAALGVVLGFAAAFGSLALLSWSWNFLLARIREVSDAIRRR